MTDLDELLDALRAERRRNAILNIENRLLREGTLELTEEVERLREALANAMLPLEALHLSVTWELAPIVKEEIAKAVERGRAALAGEIYRDLAKEVEL